MESYYRKEDGARKSLAKEKDFLGCVRVKLLQSCPALWYPKDCKPARLLCPWDFPGKSIGVGGHFLPKGISPAQELSPRLLHLLQLAGRFFTTMPPGKPCSSLGRRGWHEFYVTDRLFFLWGHRGPTRPITSLGADQKIPDWLVKIPFLIKTETAVRLDIKYRFGIMGFSTNDAILM